MLICVAGRCGRARRNGSKWVAPWTGFTVSRTFNCIESYLIEPPTSLTAGCYLTCWQRKLAAWRRVNQYEFTSSGAAINMFGSFAALGIFGR